MRGDADVDGPSSTLALRPLTAIAISLLADGVAISISTSPPLTISARVDRARISNRPLVADWADADVAAAARTPVMRSVARVIATNSTER
jgi:hypothetical protein